LNDADNFLLITTCRNKGEIRSILNHLKSLEYSEKPNYSLIRACLEELRMKELKRLNLDAKFKTEYDNNNMTIPSPNLILWDFPRYTVTPDYFAELNNLMKKEKTVGSKNVPSYTSTNQVEPKLTLSNNVNSNLSLFNNSLQNSINQMNYDLNNNNDSGYSNNGELTKQLLNICNNQKLNQLNNANIHNNCIPGSNNASFNNNIISKFAPINKPKKDDLADNQKEAQNLNKKRTRDENLLNLDNILKNNQASYAIPNQQNQIFIINQYNKQDALSSIIESTLLNILCGNNAQNIPQPQNPLNNFMVNETFDFNNSFNNNLLNIKNFIMNNNNQANIINNNSAQNIKIEEILGLLNQNKINDIAKGNNMNMSSQFNAGHQENYSQNLLKLIKNTDVNRPNLTVKPVEKKQMNVNITKNKRTIFKIEKKSKNI